MVPGASGAGSVVATAGGMSFESTPEGALRVFADCTCGGPSCIAQLG